MSYTTLPKSVQAQMSADDNGNDDDHHRYHETDGGGARARFKNFIDKYKQLPEDFLRIPLSSFSQAQLNEYNQAISHQLAASSDVFSYGPAQVGPMVDMLDISVVEAQLVKNYGLLRMDLYCKLRVGHMVCETHTCLNGAKNPKWDGVYQFSLKPGIDSFHLEIYDENQFKMDEKIAWLTEQIPQEVFQGITVERWFPLSGQLGPNKEGSVLLVLSHKKVPLRSSSHGRSAGSRQHHGHQYHHQQGPSPMAVFVPANQVPPSGMMAPVGVHPVPLGTSVVPVIDPVAQQVPAYVQPTMHPQQEPVAQITSGHDQHQGGFRPASDADVNQLSEMFPSIDKAIIKAILENNHNDKEAAIGALLALG